MKTNILSLVIVLFLVANFCYGQDGKGTTATDTTANTAVEAENQNKIKTEKKVEIPSQMPQPFQPSEEVSADAVISFPTDI